MVDGSRLLKPPNGGTEGPEHSAGPSSPWRFVYFTNMTLRKRLKIAWLVARGYQFFVANDELVTCEMDHKYMVRLPPDIG